MIVYCFRFSTNATYDTLELSEFTKLATKCIPFKRRILEDEAFKIDRRNYMVFLDVTNAIWLFVIIFMLHDFEEIISVEHWANNNKSKLSERNTWINQRIWSFWNVNSYSFAKRDVVIFMVMSLITVITIFNLHQTWSIHLYTSFLVFILFHNVLHILQTIMLRTYTPGLYTAILLVTPYSIFLLTIIN